MTTRKIKALGEIALRVNDLDAMQTFYQDIIGLELMRRFPDSAFFKIADGYGGHTQILALFDRSSQSGYTGLSAAQTTVDHLAFTIAREDFESERARLEALGCKLKFANHDWVHWRRSTSMTLKATMSSSSVTTQACKLRVSLSRD